MKLTPGILSTPLRKTSCLSNAILFGKSWKRQSGFEKMHFRACRYDWPNLRPVFESFL